MSQNEIAHLVKMINQISTNMGNGVSDAAAAESISRHIKLFWAPSMIEKLCRNGDDLRAELNPLAFQATKLLCTE